MKEIRKKIRDILNEEVISEIVIKEAEPPYFEEFKMGPDFQYGFKTKNENIYYLSLKRTALNINNGDVLSSIEYNEEDGSEFYAANFYSSESDPNAAEAFSKNTGNLEQFLILSHLIWLINYFSETHDKKRIMFSAEPRRLRLYSNALDNFKDDFNILGPDNFDPSYEYSQILMVKK